MSEAFSQASSRGVSGQTLSHEISKIRVVTSGFADLTWRTMKGMELLHKSHFQHLDTFSQARRSCHHCLVGPLTLSCSPSPLSGDLPINRTCVEPHPTHCWVGPVELEVFSFKQTPAVSLLKAVLNVSEENSNFQCVTWLLLGLCQGVPSLPLPSSTSSPAHQFLI